MRPQFPDLKVKEAGPLQVGANNLSIRGFHAPGPRVRPHQFHSMKMNVFERGRFPRGK